MKYFEHDTGAFKDERIQALRLECGGAAVDAYWAIIECMHHDQSALVVGEHVAETRALTHWLCMDWPTFWLYLSVMGDIGLLEISEEETGGTFTLMSTRAIANIGAYEEKASKSRTNGKKGGRRKSSKAADLQNPVKKPDPNQAGSEKEPDPNHKEKEKEKEKETNTPQPPSAEIDWDCSDGGGSEGAMFIADALAVFNEATGQSIAMLDQRTIHSLQRIRDGGHTAEELRAVVESRAKAWKDDPRMSQYIRPSTLFGQKFEEYLAFARKEGDRDARYAKYR